MHIYTLLLEIELMFWYLYCSCVGMPLCWCSFIWNGGRRRQLETNKGKTKSTAQNVTCKMDSELETTTGVSLSRCPSLSLLSSPIGWFHIVRMYGTRSLCTIPCDHVVQSVCYGKRAENWLLNILWHRSAYYRITIYIFYGYEYGVQLAKASDTYSVRWLKRCSVFVSIH